nr:DUF3048 domain-containing protein [Alkaliphilus metalliredigens]
MRTLKKRVLLVTLAILMIFSVGCSRQAEEEEVEEPIIVEEPEEEVVVVMEGVPSPLSGLYVPEETIDRRPMAIVFDNHSGARPQAGLIQAEIAYEFLAEGNATRYLGIFLSEEPEVIGPIRSARPYFIQKVLEFDGYFVHVGGSPQAFHDIVVQKVADIDATSRGSNVFWRKSHKKAPHNMYSSYEALLNATKSSGFRTESTLEGFQFNEEAKAPAGEKASELHINYNRAYEPSFKYDYDEERYHRFYNEAPHVDETTGEQLKAVNIIVQHVPAKVVDSDLRLEMQTIGSGSGLYLSMGQVMEITWEKKSYSGITQYYDSEGNRLLLNPGQTWVQVVHRLDIVSIKE